jgi:pimeloyl-ACP methyl ester carboxylesterase
MGAPPLRLVVDDDPLGDHQRARGIPACRELSLVTHATVGVSAAADVGLRTMAASIVGATLAPLGLLPGRLDVDLAEVDFYIRLADAADQERSFPSPGPGHRVQAVRAARLPNRLHGARVESLRFESQFRTVNPRVRDAYAGHSRNRLAHAQHWRHKDQPRPTLCVIHGFMGSPYAFNSAFFSLPWFFAQGYDVLLYTLPFHGPRASRTSPYSGAGLFAGGISHLNEAMAHAVHDFRVFVDHLASQGVEQVGVTGLSLGGYVTALLAAVEDRLALAIPNAAIADMSTIIDSWFPANLLTRHVMPRRGLLPDVFAEAVRFHSPLTYPVRLPKERLFVIGGLGDRLAPPVQSERIWAHWGQPRLHWYPGNHVLHVNRGAYLRQMQEFFGELGFVP